MALNIDIISNLIIDMDGVLWHDERPQKGLVTFFETLHAQEINFVLATNNASKTTAQYTAKLRRFGLEVPPEQILTSAEATASYLSSHYQPGTAAYVVGGDGLYEAMRDRGFDLLNEEGVVDSQVRVEVVVVGFTRTACYDQLASAARLIFNGAQFVGSNPDTTYPTEGGPLPGAGAYLAFLERATGIEPLIIGKPAGALFAQAMERLGGTRENTAMVGDRLETDIAGAKAFGIYSILLFSGITKPQELEASEIAPDLVFNDILDMTKRLRNRCPVSTHP